MPFFLWPTYVNIIIAGLIFLITLGIAWYVKNHHNIPGAIYFILTALALSIWSIAYLLEFLLGNLEAKVILENLQFSIIQFVPFLYLLFILVFTSQRETLKNPLWALLLLMPVANLLVIWTNFLPVNFRISAVVTTHGLNFPGFLDSRFDVWFWIVTAYYLAFWLADLIVLLVAYFQSPPWARNRYWNLILAVFIPWVVKIIDLARTTSLDQDYLAISSVAISIIIIAWGILRTRILDILPIAREAILDQINHPIIILDDEGRVAEMNQLSRKRIQNRTVEWVGRSIHTMMPELQSIQFSPESIGEFEMETHFPPENEDELFDLKVTPLFDEKKKLAGWLAIFHDITEHKKEEDMLRKAEKKVELSLQQSLEQSQELSILRQTTEGLNRANSLREALTATLPTLQKLTHSPQIWLCLLDSTHKETYLQAFYSSEKQTNGIQFWENQSFQYPFLSDLLTGKLPISKKYHLSEDSTAAEPLLSKSAFCFPLRAGVIPLGVLIIAVDKNGDISTRDNSLIETLCVSLAATIDRVSLLKEQYQDRRLAQVYREINTALTASLNLNDVLDLLLKQVARLVPFDAGNVMIVENDQARIVRSRGYEFLGEKALHEGSELSFSISNTSNLRKSVNFKTPVVINNTAEDPEWHSTVWSTSFLSFLCAPVIIDNQVAMIFSLDKKEANFYQKRHVDQLITFCSEVALAIQNARLFESGQARIRELESLQTTLSDMNMQLDLDQLLKDILQRAVSLLNSSSGVLSLYREKTNDFIISYSINKGKDLSGSVIPYDQGLFGEGARTRNPITVDDYSTWVKRIDKFTRAFPHAVVEVPLLAGKDLLGILAIGDENPQRRYNQEDIRLLQLFAQQATVAISNAELFSESRRRAEEAETLREAGSIITSTLKQKQALHLILDQLAKVVPYDSASILLIRGNVLELVEGIGFSESKQFIGLRIPLNSDQPGAVVCREKKTVVVQDMNKDYPNFKLVNQNPIRSWLGIPLIYKNRTLGILALDSLESNRYSNSEASLASAFADQVAIALENITLYESALKSAQRFASLYTLSQEFSVNLRPNQVYQAVHKATCELMACDSFIISLYDRKGKMINDVYFIDHQVVQTNESRPLGIGLFSKVIRENKPLMFNNFSEEEASQQKAVIIGDKNDQTLVQSLIIVPLRIGQQVKGVLSAQSYSLNAYTDEDKDTLELLGNQCAIALENIRLFDEVEQMAMTDSLTNIYNRRKFFDLAENEYERARRYKHPVSVIMMDIDLFKDVNDTYGHASGDIALSHIAELSRSTIRNIDILARYGGEEFVILLPETTANEAFLTAERLRLLVERTPIKIGENQISITLSFGVAELDASCKNIEQLLDRSDQAMYASKRNGRNRVTIWTKESYTH